MPQKELRGLRIRFYVGVICIIISIVKIIKFFATLNICKEDIILGILLVVCLLHIFSLFIKVYWELIELRQEDYSFQEFRRNELEMIEDAKELIKSANKSIELAEFQIYKAKLKNKYGTCYHNDKANISEIYIDFTSEEIMKTDINFAFATVVHEILHSQYNKYGMQIFKVDFEEGLTELLTNWLIKKYSKKYKVPKQQEYGAEIKIVRDVLSSSNVKIKDLYMKYNNFDISFFVKIVPKKYLTIGYRKRKNLTNTEI